MFTLSLHRTQVSTNTFVGAYIDRLLEQQQLASGNERNSSTASTAATGIDVSDDDSENRHQQEAQTRGSHNSLGGGLTFENFVHIFWVFSASASRAEKEEG